MAAVALTVTNLTLRAPSSLASRRRGSEISGTSNANHRMPVSRRQELGRLVKLLMLRLAKFLPMPALDRITRCRVYLIAPDTGLASTAMSGQTLFAATRLRYSPACVSVTNQRL